MEMKHSKIIIMLLCVKLTACSKLTNFETLRIMHFAAEKIVNNLQDEDSKLIVGPLCIVNGICKIYVDSNRFQRDDELALSSDLGNLNVIILILKYIDSVVIDDCGLKIATSLLSCGGQSVLDLVTFIHSNVGAVKYLDYMVSTNRNIEEIFHGVNLFVNSPRAGLEYRRKVFYEEEDIKICTSNDFGTKNNGFDSEVFVNLRPTSAQALRGATYTTSTFSVRGFIEYFKSKYYHRDDVWWRD